MALLIGMDEAGYGPNLGPLVITAVAWRVPGDPRRIDLWQEFAGIVSQEPAADGRTLQVADSKVVYSPARGLAALEQGVLTAVRMWQQESAEQVGSSNGMQESRPPPQSFAALRELVRAAPIDELASEPWFSGADLPLPCAGREANRELPDPASLAEPWRGRCRSAGLRLLAIRSELVGPERFNAEVRRHDSKGRALSELTLRLLGDVLRGAAEDERVLVIADKHGGRNRYHEFLPLAFGDQFIRCRGEGLERSHYEIGRADIRFETRSERHFPVALASMVSKYLRELAMILFNRFWTSRLPELRETAGYPTDAVRFRREIADLQRALRIEDDVLWRMR